MTGYLSFVAEVASSLEEREAGAGVEFFKRYPEDRDMLREVLRIAMKRDPSLCTFLNCGSTYRWHIAKAIKGAP